MVDFNKLLDQRVGEVEAPKQLPTGTYTLNIANREMGESKNKKTPFVKFKFDILGADDDVDANDLALVPNYLEKKLDDDFYLTEDALKRLEEFLVLVGVEPGLSLREGLESAVGKQVRANVVHEPYQDRNNETRYRVRIGQYAAA